MLFGKLLSVVSFACLALAAASPSPKRALRGAMCDLSNFTLDAAVPADVNEHGGPPLLPSVAEHPSWIALSVGVQNYTCASNGTWLPFGAVTELFDISCIPPTAQRSFITFIHDMWLAADPSIGPFDLISMYTMMDEPYVLGSHWFIQDPRNTSDGLLLAMWDFRKSSLKDDPDAKDAYVVMYRTGEVPSPYDPVINADWLSLAPAIVDGKKDGLLSDQNYRFNTNGGNAPNTSCTPGEPVLSVKSVTNFWMFGGKWNSSA